jgi:hypothetical protein
MTAGPAIANDDGLPDGLSASDWSSIRAVYEASQRSALTVEGGYMTRNPGQRWRTHFDGRGFMTTPDVGDWSWGLQLVRYGREGAERTVTTPMRTAADGARVDYEWDAALTEWYVNEACGLEHGYTVHEQPKGLNGGAWVPPMPCLQFTLVVRGDLRPQVSGDGRSVAFRNSNGAAVLNYSGLTVFDSDGAAVPARFDQAGNELRLTVDDRDARYPLTIDPLAQQAYLKASNTEEGDRFGWSVAVSSNTVVVASVADDSSSTGVNGDGADNSAEDSGAVYVFVRGPGGIWSQQAYLKAANSGASDFFGWSVAISGDIVVVGAPGEDSAATGFNGNSADDSAIDSGAAYVFVRCDGVWSQHAYLKASNTDEGDEFGSSVAISGDTVVVGARGEDGSGTGVGGNQFDNSVSQSGAAYVFVRGASGVWTQQAYLKASNTELGDRFGGSVALSGDTVVVGAHLEDSNATGVDGNQADNTAGDSGAAYVFVRTGEIWSQQAYLKASNTGADDQFGFAVAVSDDTVVVGAHLEDSNATGVGGNQADNGATDSGAAYIFIRNGEVWSQQAYLKASNTDANDFFGRSVAVSANIVVAGAFIEDSNATGVDGNQADNSATDSGSAYAFVRDGGVWSQQVYLKASNTDMSDFFGISVSVSDGIVVVGAIFEDSAATGVDGNQADNSADLAGAAYLFVVLNIPGDCDGDGDIDLDDFVCFEGCLGGPGGGLGAECGPFDFDGDGDVDLRDYAAFQRAFTH